MGSKALYTGKRVKVRHGNVIRAGEVVDVDGKEFCIRYDDTGTTEWLPVSQII